MDKVVKDQLLPFSDQHPLRTTVYHVLDLEQRVEGSRRPNEGVLRRDATASANFPTAGVANHQPTYLPERCEETPMVD